MLTASFPEIRRVLLILIQAAFDVWLQSSSTHVHCTCSSHLRHPSLTEGPAQDILSLRVAGFKSVRDSSPISRYFNSYTPFFGFLGSKIVQASEHFNVNRGPHEELATEHWVLELPSNLTQLLGFHQFVALAVAFLEFGAA